MRAWAAAAAPAAAAGVPLYVLSAEPLITDGANWWVRALRRAGLGSAWQGCGSQAELRRYAGGDDLPRGFWLPWSVGIAGSGIRTVLALDAGEMAAEAEGALANAPADGAADGWLGAEEGEEGEEDDEPAPPPPPPPPPPPAASASACTALALVAVDSTAAAAAAECGVCRYCLDKPKFGGKNRLRRACEQRQPAKPAKPAKPALPVKAAKPAHSAKPAQKRRQAATDAGVGAGAGRAGVGAARLGGAGAGAGAGGGAAREKRKRAGDSLAGAAGGVSATGSSAASPCSAPQATASTTACSASGVEEFAPPPLLPGLYQRIEDCDAEALKRMLLVCMGRQRPITFQMLEQGFVSYSDLKK